MQFLVFLLSYSDHKKRNIQWAHGFWHSLYLWFVDQVTFNLNFCIYPHTNWTEKNCVKRNNVTSFSVVLGHHKLPEHFQCSLAQTSETV